MSVYRNTTQGARAIHLTNGGYVLVEAGATAEVADGAVRRLGPGIMKDKGDVPDVPADLAAKVKQPDPLDHDDDGKKGGSKPQPATGDLKALRAEYKKATGKNPFNGWNAATLREKIGAV